MTRRERLEARAEQRRLWAEARDRDGDAARQRVHEITERIPFGQPILVGHHSERGARADQRRIENGMRTAVENWNMSDRHEHAAEEIGRQLKRSVFSDDTDAVEKLTAKVQRLEEKRDRVKRFNAEARKAGVGPAEAETLAREILTESEQQELRSLYRINFAGGRNGLLFPPYMLTNLGSEIRRNRGRLEEIKRTKVMQSAGDRGRPRVMSSRYAGTCPDCGESFERGETIYWFKVSREAVCERCGSDA